MGYAIDFLVALFIVWSLYRGWKLGFLYQLGQLALIALAYVVAKGLDTTVAAPFRTSELSPQVTNTIGFFVIFFLVLFVGGFLLRRMTKDLLSFSKGVGSADATLGIVFGTAKGALIAYIAIVGLIMAHRMTGKIPIPFGSSISGRWVMQHNFLDSEEFPRAKAIAQIVLIESKYSSEELAQNPHVQAILQNPKAQALLKPEIMRAVGEGDFVTLLSADEVWDFLDEPDVQQHLNAIELAAPVEDPSAAVDGESLGARHVRVGP